MFQVGCVFQGNRVTGRDGCLVSSKHSGEEGRFGECPSLWDTFVVKECSEGMQEAGTWFYIM